VLPVDWFKKDDGSKRGETESTLSVIEEPGSPVPTEEADDDSIVR
jgi:hypothetical protein